MVGLEVRDEVHAVDLASGPEVSERLSFILQSSRLVSTGPPINLPHCIGACCRFGLITGVFSSKKTDGRHYTRVTILLH